METKVALQVKDKSVVEFLKENLVEGEEKRSLLSRDGSISQNPYYSMRKEMFFKKSDKFNSNDIVVISLSDSSKASSQELVNEYCYQVEYYDDISVKLVQIGFRVYVPEVIK